MLATETAEREGKQPLAEFQIHLWRVKDGKATSFQAFPATITSSTSSGPDA